MEQEAEDLKSRLSEAVELTMMRASAEKDITEDDLHVIIDLCVMALKEVASVVEDGPDKGDEDEDDFPWFTRGERN